MGGELARRGRLIATAAVLALLLVAPASEAAFPGKPGRIAFSHVPGVIGDSEIYSVNPDGSGFAPLVSNSSDRVDIGPSHSPDGKRILFAQFNSTIMDYQVIVMNADGSGQDGLLNTLGPSVAPAFAPDGASFAYACDDGMDFEICAWKTDGSGGLPQLTNNNAEDGDPVYARDGRLFFVRDDGADREIFVRHPDGTEQQVTNNAVGDNKPDPSPDGKRLVLQRGDGDDDIVVIELDGSGETNLTNTPAAGESTPAFSPTGKQVVFRGDDDALAIVAASGGAPTPITSPADFSADPDWQPIPVRCGGKVATQVGTGAKDTLVGTSGRDILVGLGGADKLRGKGGRDILCGGKGRDRLGGGKGKNDKCIGGKGDDSGKGCEKRKSL
jgi:Tol biopolymer transport system component